MRYHRPLALIAVVVLALLSHAACGLSTAGTGVPSECEPCTTSAQCPSNPCTTSSCSAEGCCVFDALPDGDAPTAAQAAGDCRVAVCSGGVLTDVLDLEDFLDDGKECTLDGCTAEGAPYHTPQAGEVCANGLGECGATGECIIQCSATQPCPPDPDNPCIERICDVGAGTCIDQPLHGVPVPGMQQVSGDCRFWLCVNGAPENTVDNTDLPIDGNDCTADVCDVGTPSNPVLAPDTPCGPGGTGLCNGVGACVECNVPEQCYPNDPPDTFCSVRTCEQGVCGKSYPPNNTPLPVQSPGDCKTAVCDGSGNVIQVATPADLPVDNNPCTSDVCNGSTPQNPPLPPSTSCGQSSLCDGNGNCVGCLTSADCPGVDDFCKTRTCVANVCGYSFEPDGKPFPPAQQTVGDCKERQCDGAGNEKLVAKDTDLPVDGNECTNDFCTMGSPSNPPKPTDTPCSTGYCSAGVCYACNMPSQCPPPPLCMTATCNGHVCGQTPTMSGTPIPNQTQGDCKAVVCDGAGGTMTIADTGDIPNDNNPCTNDGCNGMNPTFIPAPPNTPCGTGQSCDGNGACKKNNGQSCSSSGECLSGYCVDGFCCNTACGGTCVACSAAKKGSGSNGQCGNIANNTDPDNECATQPMSSCGTDGMCNGMGACRLWAVGTVCTPSSCSGGVQQNADTCNGSGMCVDGGSMACSPYTCGATACKTTCANDADCVSSHYCSSGMCTSKKMNGLPCSAANQCQSGYCTDGVCCDSSCGGTCMACSAAKKGGGSDGVCGPIAAGSDPDDECTQQPQSTCGHDGTCNGAGQCRMWAAGTVCAPASCANATTQNEPDTCDGSGACVDGGTTSCLPLVCVSNACLATCMDDGDCASAYYCDVMTGTCEMDKMNGADCTSSSQCVSGYCVDGFCCDSSCGGICMACSALLTSAANGTCAHILQFTDDTNPMCSGTETCNGSGACLHDNGQPCTSNDECASNKCTGNPKTCTP